MEAVTYLQGPVRGRGSAPLRLGTYPTTPFPACIRNWHSLTQEAEFTSYHTRIQIRI